MKKLPIIFSLAAGVVLISCSDVKRKPGGIYMPDMAYSRAYETYADHSNLAEKDIHYNNRPVTGTIARGEELPFNIAKDVAGDSTNYLASKAVQNPIRTMTAADLAEGERLYLVNCGICHGAKLDGEGPLYKSGKYLARPKNLVDDPYTVNMPDGQMFYSITYGKNLMGPYGPQMSRKQRWMVINYIRSKQNAGKAGSATPTDSTAATTATTTTTK